MTELAALERALMRRLQGWMRRNEALKRNPERAGATFVFFLRSCRSAIVLPMRECEKLPTAEPRDLADAVAFALRFEGRKRGPRACTKARATGSAREHDVRARGVFFFGVGSQAAMKRR